jgi:hypothetical protein
MDYPVSLTDQKQKHTTGGIPRWSPTLVLVARFSAYVWQSGRDAQFSLTYGRMCSYVLVNISYRTQNCLCDLVWMVTEKSVHRDHMIRSRCIMSTQQGVQEPVHIRTIGSQQPARMESGYIDIK